MSTTVSIFGTFKEQEVNLFCLKNANGVEVKITNYGATITSIITPDKSGKLEDIVCGFNNFESYFLEEYKTNAPYFGSTVGRYCAQIKDSKFNLNGLTYQLATNCGNNNLHGGVEGFDKKIWDAKIVDNNNEAGVEMSLVSANLEEGFPGNVIIKVVFTLTNANELCIEYNAVPDEDTPLAITNHTYFNLSGFNKSIENHEATILANKKLAMDETGSALDKIVHLDNEVDDLRSPKKIKEIHKKMNDGFAHYYIFNKSDFQLKKVAKFLCEESGRSLEISTTEPGVLFYTGTYTSDKLERENGQKFGKYSGFCFETQRYPNGPNIKNSPKSITKKGEEYKSATVYKFKY
ncbi:aldose epimerase family protein [Polaribacter sp. PL03]|uniref:aldose epimerase family protein n=1 Tax=Polaribacter sp. PL03 TaxID=3088353 RepID=UPI0029CFC5B2|nr:aldose epimerase family protein [Polaribacter sp. PL03]MDX6746654.1 aldose epimerase family protein [Polaribacter sp. PL03]